MHRINQHRELTLSALVLFGAGSLWSTLHVVEGESPGDRFGRVLAAAGDVDGDGSNDLVVGAPLAGAHAAQAGSASVLSGVDGSVLATVHGEDAHDRLGSSVASAGDHDGDGRSDVLVGAPMGTPAAGEVRVVRGLDGATLRTWTGQVAGERFGAALAGLGDLNGDGVPELAVGAPESDRSGTSSGRVAVFSGRDGGLLWERFGAAWDRFGTSLADAGDLDGDGLADLIVGAPFADVGGFNSGSVLVYSGVDGALLHELHGSAPGDRLGERVAAAGDVDGDGVPDLIAVAPAEDAAAVDSGAVRVHSGASGAHVLTVPGQLAGEFLSAAAGAGDVDGDGHADVLVGSPAVGSSEGGRVRLISGATGAELAVLDGVRPGGWLGASVAGLLDPDGDGRFEFAVGAPVHDDRYDVPGRVYVLRAPAALGGTR